MDGSSELEEFGELFRGEDTDGSYNYNNKNDIGAEEISEDKPSEKQQLHVEKSSTKKRKHADSDELHVMPSVSVVLLIPPYCPLNYCHGMSIFT